MGQTTIVEAINKTISFCGESRFFTMFEKLNPHNWSKTFKDWIFRIIEITLTITVVGGFIFAIRIFLWERDIFWRAEGKIADAEVLGGFGDFVAGTIGVVLGFASMYLMFRTLKSQRGADERNAYLMQSQQFSNMFFELLNLYQRQVEALVTVEVVDDMPGWNMTIENASSRSVQHKGKAFFAYYMKKRLIGQNCA